MNKELKAYFDRLILRQDRIMKNQHRIMKNQLMMIAVQRMILADVVNPNRPENIKLLPKVADGLDKALEVTLRYLEGGYDN